MLFSLKGRPLQILDQELFNPDLHYEICRYIPWTSQ
jgi:hypothetical protein